MPRPPVNPKDRKLYKGKEISDFAKNIRAKRLALGLKQSDLAEMIGTSTGKISQIEGGVFPSMPERIVLLARALKVDINWLFNFNSEENNHEKNPPNG